MAAKRTYRRGRLYYCGKCGNYSWRDLRGQIETDAKRPEWAPRVTGRTCNDCLDTI